MANCFDRVRDVRRLPAHLQSISGLAISTAAFISYAVGVTCLNIVPLLLSSANILFNIAAIKIEIKNKQFISYPATFLDSLSKQETVPLATPHASPTGSTRSLPDNKKVTPFIPNAFILSCTHLLVAIVSFALDYKLANYHEGDKACDNEFYHHGLRALFATYLAVNIAACFAASCINYDREATICPC